MADHVPGQHYQPGQSGQEERRSQDVQDVHLQCGLPTLLTVSPLTAQPDVSVSTPSRVIR
ncbi:MAG: hypothetical protein JWP48_6162 [Actinoallomurus sp.]|jgi:hypothetical protein|nr:hypothetical protein [Actinoallomurus sp.]